MKYIYYGISLMLLVGIQSNWLIAQTKTNGSIQGKITDAKTGAALPWVNIKIDGTRLGAATDEQGNYFIRQVPVADNKVRNWIRPGSFSLLLARIIPVSSLR